MNIEVHVIAPKRLVSRDGLRVSVARLGWEIYYDRPLLPTEYLHRTCDTENCVAPYHQQVLKRSVPRRLRCPNGHEYTVEDWWLREGDGWSVHGDRHRCHVCREARNARRRKGTMPYWAVEVLRTHCPQGHEYTPENTYRYGNNRKCKTCTIERAKTK